jgi:hypothetical protein
VRSPGCNQTGLWGFLPDYPVQLNLYYDVGVQMALVSFYEGSQRRAVFQVSTTPSEVDLVALQ